MTGKKTAPKTELEVIAKTLEGARRDKGWSLRDAERQSKVSNGYISQVEQALVRPSPDVLHKLADAYEVPYRLLMERTGYIRAEADLPNRDKVPAFVFSAAEVFDDRDWEMAQKLFEQLQAIKKMRPGKD